jgi:hypothetical protein
VLAGVPQGGQDALADQAAVDDLGDHHVHPARQFIADPEALRRRMISCRV